MVADALSREPFVRFCIAHRLVTEPYSALLAQVSELADQRVQDAFRCTNNCQLVSQSGDVVDSPPPQTSLSFEDVQAVLGSHDPASVSQIRGTSSDIPQLTCVNDHASLPKSQTANMQEQDVVLGRAEFSIMFKDTKGPQSVNVQVNPVG